jgi:hypothetical protein
VGLLGIIHVKVDLLDNIDDVRMGRRQVLEGPTRRRPWHVCPPVLKPACGPPCQLAEEYREQIIEVAWSSHERLFLVEG